jgi:hypothetical protein
MYIFSPNRVVLVRLGLDYLPVRISLVSFCYLESFSTVDSIHGERVWVVFDVYGVLTIYKNNREPKTEPK